MPRIKHPQWQESHQGNRYPFADNATLVNNAGMFIPESLFADAAFYPVGATAGLYLSKIVLTHDKATLVLGDDDSAELASAEFELLSPPAQALFYDTYGRPAGVVVSEPTRLASLQSWTVGTHEFTSAQTAFAATCCIPTPELGVRGILLDDGSVITGDAYLVGMDGVILSTDEVTTNSPGCVGRASAFKAITVNVVGDPLFKRRECGNLFQDTRFLQGVIVEAHTCRIECGPNDFGDIQLTSGSLDTLNPVLRIKKHEAKSALYIEAAGTKVGGGDL